MANILFYSIAVLIFVLIVFDRVREDKKWISIMVATGSNCYKLNEKYAYLKANSIRCRIKNIGGMGTEQAVINTRDVQSLTLEVYYKDMEKAEQLLEK